MSKHTKGPWVRGGGGPSEYTILSGDISGGSITNSTLIACTEKCPEEKANALLIAAAPELLEVLKKLVSHGTEGPAWTEARKLIAKAEGGNNK